MRYVIQLVHTLNLIADLDTLKTSGLANNFVTYVVLGPRKKQTGGEASQKRSLLKHVLIEISVQIYRITIQIENGMSSTKCVEHAFIGTAGLEIKDAKFIDDDEVVIAAVNESK